MLKKCLGMENGKCNKIGKWKMCSDAAAAAAVAFAHGIIWARTWSRIAIWHFIGNNKSSGNKSSNNNCNWRQ